MVDPECFLRIIPRAESQNTFEVHFPIVSDCLTSEISASHKMQGLINILGGVLFPSQTKLFFLRQFFQHEVMRCHAENIFYC